jgi:hypothetical protein
MSSTTPTGFPTADTTGVPSGTNLTTYTGPMTISTEGTVIENKIINGTLRVTADNVVIKNCLVQNYGFWGIDAEGASNFTVQDSTFVGPGYSDSSNAAILGSGTFLRNDISGSENGIVLDKGASTVKGNYIHDLAAAGADPHYDGISVQGGQHGVLIEDNTVIGRDTSDVFIKNDFGPISDVTVNHNFLAGDPGYNIYVDGRASGGPITDVTITDNYLKEGRYGYVSVDKSSPTISGNIESADGSSWPPVSDPVPAQPAPTDPAPTGPTTSDPTPTKPTPKPTEPAPNDPGHAGPTDPGQSSGPDGFDFTGLWSKWDSVKLQGKADPGDILKFYDGSTLVGSAKAEDDGSWTFSKTGLTKQVHTLTAQEVDNSGHVVAKSAGAAILGSQRSDTLKSTTGDDLFLSKGGHDTFVFAADFGKDLVKDFDAVGRHHDVLQFSKSVFDDFASVLDQASQVGRDVVISDGSDTLTLKNVKLSSLDSHDFHFA